MVSILRRHDLPLRRRIWLLFYRYWYRVRSLRTPLTLRRSLGRLRHNHDRPWLALLRLFIPYPTWRFPVPEPASPQELLGNESLMLRRRYDLINLFAIPLWRARDTPLRSLYRMNEAMLSGEYSPVGQETEYFWYQPSWRLASIPDPADPDPIRYAMLACLVEELVTALNWRLSLGMRRNGKHILRKRNGDPYPPYNPVSGPAWTRDVPPIPRESLVGLPPEFVRDGCKLVLQVKGVSEVFAKRNIVTNVGWLYTI
ncbi:hypothetical protein AJ80_04021 [Polytolypa hystricis UAMH7299]|uniref:Uncharacterized protein n=1 Tax=Polytolypa hystricis (strain UAMH7299) TaxID=1447883 RepID=A0A2B7YDW6_POLH7|nr:hypothetical protein AJ80_04021 [Polytolypa hystricis UAMH7299]